MNDAELLRLRDHKVETYYSIAGVPPVYWSLRYLDDAMRFASDEAVGKFEEVWEGWYYAAGEDLMGAGGLYLYGAHDTGKTSLAILAMLSLCDYLEDRPDPLYLHAGRFIAQCRVGKGQSILRRAEQASVFVLDDIGTEADTDYAREQLTTLLEIRFGVGYPNIVTGNIAPEDLPDTLGGRIASRVTRFCTMVEI